MTEKQKRCIDWICGILEIEFTGTTKKEAWEFINQYKDEATAARISALDYDREWWDCYMDEGYYC